jgi:hypothetical protein
VKGSKLVVATSIVASIVMSPILSAASGNGPHPITIQRMDSDIQREVNTAFPTDEASGERTSCNYVESRMRDGYRFTCATYNKSGREITDAKITVTDPRDRYWTWHYDVAPYVPLNLTGAKATYIVTGAPGTKADITINDVAGSINKLNVMLPFTITEVGGIAASLTAMDLSTSKGASITCTIEESHVATYTRTATGPHAFVTCA